MISHCGQNMIMNLKVTGQGHSTKGVIRYLCLHCFRNKSSKGYSLKNVVLYEPQAELPRLPEPLHTIYSTFKFYW